MNFKYLLLLGIIILSLTLRFYGLNWDQNNHLHPDERMITLVTLKLHIPLTSVEWDQILTSQSSLNPNFFAYGSFPIYLLFFLSQLLHKTSYDDLAIIGRTISAFFDIGTLLTLYFLGKKILNQNVGLLAAFFYCVSVFPIQAAHFYAVDTMLTFFITLELLLLVHFYQKPSTVKIIIIGICFGLAMATKTSAFLLTVPIILTIFLTSQLGQILDKNPTKISLIKSAWFLILTGISTVITFLIFEPFALIDKTTFIKQNLEQQQMTKNAFTFPYTLQFVGDIPYWYEIKNIFLWGLGPLVTVLAGIGLVLILTQVVKQNRTRVIWLILLSYIGIYFGIVGNFAVGYMRYMLPLYPFLSLLAGVSLNKLFDMGNKINLTLSLSIIFTVIILSLVWPLSFMAIYTHPNTRTQATEWILNNIPSYSSIAQEYWDDGIPVGGNYSYKIIPMSIYEMTNPVFNQKAYDNLSLTDYYIISSNRIYLPLMKIAANCNKWNVPNDRCPTNASIFYQQLFSGNLGFVKVAEFTSLPTIPLINLQIDDSLSDESFTVYDHPKVMIFKKY